MRGIFGADFDGVRTSGLTPAHAWNMALYGQRAARTEAHPRRMRGILRHGKCHAECARLATVHAGNIQSQNAALWRGLAHPRACGEYLAIVICCTGAIGAHPRKGGEYRDVRRLPSVSIGSPPCMRGILSSGKNGMRLTPAHAGNIVVVANFAITSERDSPSHMWGILSSGKNGMRLTPAHAGNIYT